MARVRHGFVRRVLRALSYVLLGLGVLAFVWAFVIWKWSDPVTALYTRYEQHQLKIQYVHVREQVVKSLPSIPPTTSIAGEASAAHCSPAATGPTAEGGHRDRADRACRGCT